YVGLHTRIGVHASSLEIEKVSEENRGKVMLTTVGKIIFNEIMPPSFPYINEPTRTNLENKTPDEYFVQVGKLGEGGLTEYYKDRPLVKPFENSYLGQIIAEIFNKYHMTETSVMLDPTKDLGFKYSPRAGITVAESDIVVLPYKHQSINETEAKVKKVPKQL